ncbi:MAG: hypothetical protein M3N53_02735 [Actinomycetota bacterium]|nr:hypothetical protein [Actinomycetota bacterium]
MRSALRVAIASILVFVAFQAASPAAAELPDPLGATALDDPERDCLELVPESAGVSGVSDDGQVVKLEVMVLLDRMPKGRAGAVMERVSESYAPLGIEIVVTGYRRISVPADPPRPGGSRPAAGHEALFAAMEKAVGGARPKGSDVVHLLTGKDVYYRNAEGEPVYALGGMAACIGGVRYDEEAFSFSEGVGEYDELRDDMAAVIAAHEVGHLMGAHHHYGNCAQGSPLMQENETPCTVMFPFMIVWNAGNFGTLEGAVVRGHAVDFASP